MKTRENKIGRRDFFKTVSAAGLGAVIASTKAAAGPNEPNVAEKAEVPRYPQVPRCILGKTGAEVPVLSLGVMFNTVENQAILRSSLEWGVNYWDTAYSYAGGNSEIGIGKFLEKNPDVRKKIFLVTKASNARKEPTPKARVEKAEQLLQESLKRMHTDYIDLYYGVHGLSEPEQLDDELRQWAESAKKRKLIRFFGFTTHKNMEKCLEVASKLEWIDAIMVKYNFRLMQGAEMKAAVESCHKAGIGLIAMKVQALKRRGGVDEKEDAKLLGHFSKKGFTDGQVKIKAVLADGKINSACVGMKTVALLTENAGAVLDKTKLTQADKRVLAEYAQATCRGFCAGCAEICDAALPGMPYVSDVMRYLMYYNSYGDKERARALFAQIPSGVRNKLLSADYSLAEARCPQRIPIGEAMAEAVRKLA